MITTTATSNQLHQLFTSAFREHWELDLFSDYKGDTLTYGEVAQKIEGLKKSLEKAGLQKGDHIAIYARNSTNWAISFFATMAFGGVVVPLLPDFTAENVHHLLEHSESKALFVADSLYAGLEKDKLADLALCISTDDFSIQGAKAKNAIDKRVKAKRDTFEFEAREDEDLLILSYTSGSMGFSKGVMLPTRSIESNVIYAREHMPLKAGDRLVSFLPMAHMFGLAFEILFPVSLGCHITIVTKVPSPQILLNALREVKPHLILMVPLVIEKVYKKRIVPSLNKPVMKALLAIPGLRQLIFQKTRDKMVESFGGNFHEVVLGGAALSPEVEAFFRKIKFPFTIGYGMTECGPLISYAPATETQKSSSGELVDRMEVRIESGDPYKKVGEIQVKGRNMMLGYFKNEEANANVFTEDGWLKTGDLGIIDKQDFIFIKGRSKNMLLGASGQNIYPEELEARLSNYAIVQECVIVQRENKLVALVFTDAEAMKEESVSREQLPESMEEIRKSFNDAVANYERLASIEIVEEEFDKTPKKNIKRFLYS